MISFGLFIVILWFITRGVVHILSKFDIGDIREYKHYGFIQKKLQNLIYKKD